MSHATADDSSNDTAAAPFMPTSTSAGRPWRPDFERLAAASPTTHTSVKLAQYMNPAYPSNLCTLATLLEEIPKSEPADCLYEGYPIYWRWVADGGLHNFASEHGLPSDFLRYPQPKGVVGKYLDILQSIKYMAGQSLNDFVEIAVAKKYGPGPDADRRTWLTY